MKTYWFGLLLLVVGVAAAGCGGTSEKRTAAATKPGDTAALAEAKARIDANLAKLDPADRKQAEAQKFCPISDEPLGEMGRPVKVMVAGQPVFLCCSSCERRALADPDRTLAKVNELKKGAGR